MQTEERQKRIDEHLAKVEFASLEELSELVDASVSTVRRDLDIMEAQGSIQRTHGGARLANPKSDEFTFSARDTHQLSEKEAIGEACAELISPNQTIIVDAGTTCFHVARHLEAKTPHIITNSLPVANAFSSTHKLEVVVSGGVIYPRLGVLVGPLAVASFAQVHADVAIMSCGGISPEGVRNSHGLLIDIQRAMMQAARRIIMCVDHTKFGRQSISHLCELKDIDTIVTDQSPPVEMQAALKKAGVELIVATADGPKVILKSRTKSPKPK
ncbi:MAG: DeoR/GlpR transcriptional regulator [Verrucomicrobia bacterium]|nr:DeoR/GlpR transcriptional regulator [Verrucomicrobiota bacterium]